LKNPQFADEIVWQLRDGKTLAVAKLGRLESL